MYNETPKHQLLRLASDQVMRPSRVAKCASCGACCHNCAWANGYFLYDRTPDEIKELKQTYDFTADKGFLGPQGCKLPRELRSVTCLSYVCGNLRVSQKAKSKLHELKADVQAEAWDNKIALALGIKQVVEVDDVESRNE